MTREFDKDHWESHWRQAEVHASGSALDPNPHLVHELRGLPPGTALDAGCGEGSEARWLAAEGWSVTAVDISAEALARAAERAQGETEGGHLRWVEADLTSWEPDAPFDLVTTLYAHPTTAQLAFYERLAGWVAPGGTLLIVGHLRSAGSAGHGQARPEQVTITAASVAALLDRGEWDIVTAEDTVRTVAVGTEQATQLDDVVVRAARCR